MVIAALPKLLNVLLNICDHLTQNVVCVTGKILLTGHDLQAKCEVGNALCRQKGLFRMLGCRTKCLTKTVKDTTIVGRQLQVMVSPNLTTPAWTAVITKLQNRPVLTCNVDTFLVYVRHQGCADVDDDFSMQDLKKRLKAKAVIEVVYYKTEGDMTRGRTDSSICFNAEMQFENKKVSATKILEEIRKKVPNITNPSAFLFIPGRNRAIQRPVPEHTSSDIKPLNFSKEESSKIIGMQSDLYIYIYRERERERGRGVYMTTCHFKSHLVFKHERSKLSVNIFYFVRTLHFHVSKYKPYVLIKLTNSLMSFYLHTF